MKNYFGINYFNTPSLIQIVLFQINRFVLGNQIETRYVHRLEMRVLWRVNWGSDHEDWLFQKQ